jgi:type IV pilus assembly protein PilO
VQIASTTKTPGTDELQLDVTAKTYRYLDEEEQAAAQPQGPAGKPAGRKPPPPRQPAS